MLKEKKLRTAVYNVGLPPGTLVHIGSERSASARLTVINYCTDWYEERELTELGELAALPDNEGITWLHLTGTCDVAAVEALGAAFRIFGRRLWHEF